VAPPAVGQPAGALQRLGLAGYPPDTRPPGFSATTVDGHALSLESLRSRVVLLNFWATWCLECRVEMPALEQLHRDYASRGLTVLAVNFREKPETVRQYARELGLTMPLVLDSAGDIRQSYGVIGFPTSFLIGRDGRAVARAIGPREWASAEARTLIESLLMEATGPR
jgi:thiol-disulfide isomerase/thioredoxin